MDNKKIGNSTVGGLGFAEVLTVIFIVLKLCKVINWSWIWVLSPLWIGFILGALIILITYIFIYFLNR